MAVANLTCPSTSLKAANKAGHHSFISHTVLYRRFLCAVILCLATLHARAETSLPISPTPQHVFSKTDWALSAGVLAIHLGDYLSTEQGVREPARFREANLPQALVHNHVGLAAYEFASASLEVFGAYELTKLGHPRIARVIQAVNIGYTARTVASNYELDWTTPKVR